MMSQLVERSPPSSEVRGSRPVFIGPSFLQFAQKDGNE